MFKEGSKKIHLVKKTLLMYVLNEQETIVLIFYFIHFKKEIILF